MGFLESQHCRTHLPKQVGHSVADAGHILEASWVHLDASTKILPLHHTVNYVLTTTTACYRDDDSAGAALSEHGFILAGIEIRVWMHSHFQSQISRTCQCTACGIRCSSCHTRIPHLHDSPGSMSQMTYIFEHEQDWYRSLVENSQYSLSIMVSHLMWIKADQLTSPHSLLLGRDPLPPCSGTHKSAE